MNLLIRDILAVLPGGAEVCSVYICDGVIASTSTVPKGFKADKIIFGNGKMLIPGLVNAHTHAAMSIFRSCADDLLFNEWLFGKIQPMEDLLCGDDCYWGIMLAALEMLRTGTTSFIDMYYFTDESARAILESGIRCVFSRGIAGDADVVESKLRTAIDEIDRWSGNGSGVASADGSGSAGTNGSGSVGADGSNYSTGDGSIASGNSSIALGDGSNIANDKGRLTFMLGPHAPYTCDEGFQREVAAEAARRGIPINTHLAESLAEIDTIKERYGCTPIELVDRNGLLTETTVAAHCVHLSDSDIRLLAERGVNVVTNPVSNLKLANGIAPVMKMREAGVKLALGTDSAASNNSLNMFRDLAMLALIHKGANHDALAITAREGFEMATVHGARAMGHDDLGEIRQGAIADLAVIDLDRPNMQPLNDPVAALAYSANGSEVETVMVGGDVLMENGEFLTIDKDRVYHEISAICKRLGM
ncbi:MAG: amidohydrolase family protein [Oscillospiraceae bacterium]|nr:amidohydrolase family protein [Oscillospiraceae bacterium]